MTEENKESLLRRRAQLITRLTNVTSPEGRVHTQGELSLINAKIKAINTTEAARLKAVADQRKIAGLAEAQANAARAVANALTTADGAEPPALDAWLDAVFLRYDVEFSRDARGKLAFPCGPAWGVVEVGPLLEALIAGLHAVAHGQALPNLPPGDTRRSRKTKPRRAPSSG